MDPIDFLSSDSGLDTPSPQEEYPETPVPASTDLETLSVRDESSVNPPAEEGDHQQDNQILSIAQYSRRTIQRDYLLSSRGVEETRGLRFFKKHDTFSPSVREAFPAYLQTKKANSKVISDKDYLEYIDILAAGPDAPFPLDIRLSELKKLRVKRKRVLKDFIFQDGLLYYIRGGELKPVVTAENLLDTVESVHESLLHGGQNATWHDVDRSFYGITRDDVEWLVERCSHCHLQQANNTRAPLTPIVSSLHVERIQIDLVDLRYDASHGYKWFLHVKDHFSKVSKLYPLKDKRSAGIADHLREYFRYYGTPEIVQSDHGKEFRGAVEDLMNQRNIKISQGGPRNPRVQGLVEQANGAVKKKILTWRLQWSRSDWQHSLQLIEMGVNRSQCKGLPKGYTPHKALLGQHRRLENNAKTATFETTDKDIDLMVMIIDD